jgi:hypothetical protein
MEYDAYGVDRAERLDGGVVKPAMTQRASRWPDGGRFTDDPNNRRPTNVRNSGV